MAEDKLILVDIFDRPVGSAGKAEAHRRGLLHRFWCPEIPCSFSSAHCTNIIRAVCGLMPAAHIRVWEKHFPMPYSAACSKSLACARPAAR